MAEERDPLVSRRYRELGGEEPPAELDERILARSRRPRSFQWHGPVAAAAVIVLAVAVTVHVEREQPEKEEQARAAEAPKAEPGLKRERLYAPDPPKQPDAAPAARRGDAGSARDTVRSESAPQPPPPAAQEAPAERALEAQWAPAAGAAADSAESRLAKLAEQSPERWLEGIVELRAQGRHAEADESFKRFRERYPDYAIPVEMKAKLERR